MSALIGLFAGGWTWLESGNIGVGVLMFLFVWFALGMMNFILDLFTTKEGGVVLGLLAIVGLGFMLGGDDDCDV